MSALYLAVYLNVLQKVNRQPLEMRTEESMMIERISSTPGRNGVRKAEAFIEMLAIKSFEINFQGLLFTGFTMKPRTVNSNAAFITACYKLIQPRVEFKSNTGSLQEYSYRLREF